MRRGGDWRLDRGEVAGDWSGPRAQVDPIAFLYFCRAFAVKARDILVNNLFCLLCNLYLKRGNRRPDLDPTCSDAYAGSLAFLFNSKN
jgi:hypothetical protein